MIRKRRDGLQVQVYAGRDPLTGRKRYVSQQVPGQTKASMRQAKQVEARLLEEVGAGRHKGSRSRSMSELLQRWLSGGRLSGRSLPTTVSSYRAAMDRYILPALGKLPVRQVDAATLDAARLLAIAMGESPELGCSCGLPSCSGPAGGSCAACAGRISTSITARS